ncbi:AMP-binding protein [Nocardia sp. NPDC001965]
MIAPDRAFLIDEHRSWTYRRADTLISGMARALLECGVTVGTPVGVLTPNSAFGFMTILAILRAGGVWVPLNVRNEPQSNATYLVSTSTEFCVVADDLTDVSAQVSAYRSEIEWLRMSELVEMAAHQSGDSPVLPDVSPADLAVLMPTGGTTGEPKAARLTHRVFDIFVASVLSSMPVADATAVHLIAAPMTHAAGFLAFALMSKGATNLVHRQVMPSAILPAIETHAVTHLFLPPTVIYMLLAEPTLGLHDYSSLQNFIYAAAPMSVAKLGEAITAFGAVMTQFYGQAEAPMAITYLSPADHAAALEGGAPGLASCGRWTPYVDLAILDAEGARVGVGCQGEICVRGDLVMEGYHNGAPINRADWHHTGDVGYLDADGYLYITDRMRDMIISGGFNIYPSEIEQVLWSHPAVQDCAVVGVPDSKWGEAVTAVVQFRPGMSTSETELRTYVRERLGGMKTPKAVHFWADLPRSPVGKVLRRKVRDSFWELQDRMV